MGLMRLGLSWECVDWPSINTLGQFALCEANGQTYWLTRNHYKHKWNFKEVYFVLPSNG